MFVLLLIKQRNDIRINQLMEVIAKAERLSDVNKELTELYKLLEKYLFVHFRRIFKSFIPPHTIEDLQDGYSEGWEKLLIKRRLYNPEKSIKAIDWIKIVIENSIRNVFNYGKNHHSIKLLDETEDGGYTTNTQAIVLQSEERTKITLFKNEIDYYIHLFLEKDSYVSKNSLIRQVFELRFYEDKPSTEIAKELGIANSTVTKYYTKTLERLQEFFRLNGYEVN